MTTSLGEETGKIGEKTDSRSRVQGWEITDRFAHAIQPDDDISQETDDRHCKTKLADILGKSGQLDLQRNLVTPGMD